MTTEKYVEWCGSLEVATYNLSQAIKEATAQRRSRYAILEVVNEMLVVSGYKLVFDEDYIDVA